MASKTGSFLASAEADDQIFRLGAEQTAVLIAKIEENLNRRETLRRTLDETRIRLWPDES